MEVKEFRYPRAATLLIEALGVAGDKLHNEAAQLEFTHSTDDSIAAMREAADMIFAIRREIQVHNGTRPA